MSANDRPFGRGINLQIEVRAIAPMLEAWRQPAGRSIWSRGALVPGRRS